MFDLVVSLGGYCQPGIQIRRWAGGSPGFFEAAGTPFWAAKCLIENDAEGLAETLVCTNNSHDLACERYGVLLHHEFERDAEGRVRLNANSIAKAQSSLQLRWKRQAALIGRSSRVLFIRQHGYLRRPSAYEQYTFDPELFGSGELWRMTTAIEKRWPGLRYHFAFAYYPELGAWDFSDPVANVSTHAFSHTSIVKTLPPELHWRGYEPDWDNLFTDLGVPRVGHAQPAQAAA